MASYHYLFYDINEENTVNNIRDNVSDFSDDEHVNMEDELANEVEDAEPVSYMIIRVLLIMVSMINNKLFVVCLGYELMQPRFEAKMMVLREQNQRAAEWLERIPRSKWTQAFDQGRRYGHMTTNLAECINSVLKGVRALPITAIVKSTFYRLSDLFLNKGRTITNMMREGNVYCDEVRNAMVKNQQRAISHFVRNFTRDTGEFEVQELVNPHMGGRAQVCKVNLSTWWCDCGEFQAYRFPCSHALAACAYINMDSQQFIAPVYRLDFMLKIYENEFHPLGNEEYWIPYTGPKFHPNSERRRDTSGRPRTSRIHNEMDTRDDQLLLRCGLCRSQGHNRRTCPYRQVNVGQSSQNNED